MKKNRILSLFLCISMFAGIISPAAFAESPEIILEFPETEEVALVLEGEAVQEAPVQLTTYAWSTMTDAELAEYIRSGAYIGAIEDYESRVALISRVSGVADSALREELQAIIDAWLNPTPTEAATEAAEEVTEAVTETQTEEPVEIQEITEEAEPSEEAGEQETVVETESSEEEDEQETVVETEPSEEEGEQEPAEEAEPSEEEEELVTPAALDKPILTIKELNEPEMFLKQEIRGTCTLAASAMLIRRAARANGYADWRSITESSLRPYAWIDGTGIMWNFSMAGINVSHGTFNNCTEETLIALLREHPEGVVCYNANVPHAVLITDYTNGIFYCGDPGYEAVRKPVEYSVLSKGTQEATIKAFTAYWYVSSPDIYVDGGAIIPAAGANLTATSNGDNTVSLQWRFVSGTGYRIERADSSSGPWTHVGEVRDSATTTWIDPSAEMLRSYYYRVLPYDANGNVGQATNVAACKPDRQVEHVADGICGADARWALYKDNVLLIAGSGTMSNFAEEKDEPWYEYRDSISAVVVYHGITNIGRSAFGGCKNISSVTIPASVQVIRDWAFRGCEALKSVELPDGLTTIGDAAFRQCNALTSVVIPDSVTAVGSWAFSNCANLSAVTLPVGLTSIGTAVFYEDAKLSSVSIPETVTEIGDHAFRGCSALGIVVFPEKLEKVGQYAFAMSGVMGADLTRCAALITLGEGAFYNCQALATVTLSAAKVEKYAFAYCPVLQNLRIMQGAGTVLDAYTFYNCTRLAQITVNGSAPSISSSAFANVNATVTYPTTNATWASVVGKNYGGKLIWGDADQVILEGSCGENATWLLTGSGKLCITGSGPMADYYSEAEEPWLGNRGFIHEVVVSNGVTTVGRGAFGGCSSITSVMIPGTVTAIKDWAFRGCSALTAVSMTSGLESIGYAAFRQCDALQQISIPDTVTTVGDWAFSSCPGLMAAKLSNGMKALSFAMFYEDAKLSSVIMPESLERIGDHSLRGCKVLSSVMIPRSVNYIGKYAFALCNGITGIDLTYNTGKVTVGEGAFYNCSSLNSVALGDCTVNPYAFAYCFHIKNVTIRGVAGSTIGAYAFYYGIRLTQINLSGVAPSIDATAFANVKATAYCNSADSSWDALKNQNFGGELTWA